MMPPRVAFTQSLSLLGTKIRVNCRSLGRMGMVKGCNEMPNTNLREKSRAEVVFLGSRRRRQNATVQKSGRGGGEVGAVGAEMAKKQSAG
eukprot:974212-Prorocentrum_minimum.AAC.1